MQNSLVKTSEGKLQKLPPQNIEAEEAILGAILKNPVCFNKVADMLNSNSFYKPAHKIIYEAIVELFNKNQEQNKNGILLNSVFILWDEKA